MSHNKWYTLDNTGNLYPSVLTQRNTTLFRIAAQLKRPVHVDRLNRALQVIIARFPYYHVQLSRGAFWYSFEENDRSPEVVIDSRSPCQYMPIKKRGVFPFRVRAFRSNIAVEFSHAISDATGALIFLKSLLAQYFLADLDSDSQDYRNRIEEYRKDPEIFLADEKPEQGEEQDAFWHHFDRTIPSPDQEKKVYHLPGTELPPQHYRVLTGEILASELIKDVKSHQVSVTDYLTSVYFWALQSIQERKAPHTIRGKWKPISVMVPVNLRKILRSHTMRNFFLVLNPLLDTRLGHYDFEEITAKVHHFMRTQLDRRHLKQQIARNIRGAIHPLQRIAPLWMKDIALKSVYRDYGESRYSGSLSNLGRIELPDSMESEVEKMIFVPPPSPVVKAKAGVLSYKGKMQITFGSLVQETDLELEFFSFLRKKGIRVRIDGNYKGDE